LLFLKLISQLVSLSCLNLPDGFSLPTLFAWLCRWLSHMLASSLAFFLSSGTSCSPLPAIWAAVFTGWMFYSASNPALKRHSFF
jgi:hypothetical protein